MSFFLLLVISARTFSPELVATTRARGAVMTNCFYECLTVLYHPLHNGDHILDLFHVVIAFRVGRQVEVWFFMVKDFLA